LVKKLLIPKGFQYNPTTSPKAYFIMENGLICLPTMFHVEPLQPEAGDGIADGIEPPAAN